MDQYQYFYHSPVGVLSLIASKTHILEISFASFAQENSSYIPPILLTCKEQLDLYFSGKLIHFDLPIEFKRGTPFQQTVWRALSDIPYGQTASYKDIAVKVGNPKAVRAVGGANNKNPIVIVIPCHRVIGNSGKLVGYGGGIDKKVWLLNHENKEYK